MDLSDASEKIPSDTTGNRSGDFPTSNQYATPGPEWVRYWLEPATWRGDRDLPRYNAYFQNEG
jgi:hypothetical protein